MTNKEKIIGYINSLNFLDVIVNLPCDCDADTVYLKFVKDEHELYKVRGYHCLKLSDGKTYVAGEPYSDDYLDSFPEEILKKIVLAFENAMDIDVLPRLKSWDS